MPILDLRIRKGVRRHRVKLCVATSRPSSLDANAAAVARYAPGAEEAFAAALTAALAGGDGLDDLAGRGGHRRRRRPRARAGARRRRRGRRDRVGRAADRRAAHAHAARALLNLAGRARPERGHDGAGLLAVPATANGRGLREAGVLPNAGPGLSELEADGRGAPQIAAGGRRRRARRALPAARRPARVAARPRRCGTARWTARRPSSPTPQFLTDGLREHADVVFPAESDAEKEGTVTHPDGRVQRLRPAIARPGDVRAEWQILAELAKRLGADPQVLTGAMVSQRRLRRRAVLRGPDARRARPATACAGPSATAAAGWPAADHGPFELERPAERRVAQRRAAPGQLPLDLGRRPRSELAGAEVPAPQRAGRAVAGRRPAPAASPTATASSSPTTATASRRPSPLRDAMPGRQRVRRGDRRPHRRPAPRCAAHDRSPPSTTPSRGGPDHQGDRDLRGRPPARADRADRRAQAARALPAALRPQPRRPVRLRSSRWPTSSSSRPRSSSARGRRSAGCTCSRR